MNNNTPLISAVLYDRLRPQIKIMAQIQERKFREHSNRGNPFRDCDWDFLLMRQREEQGEFCKAIKDCKSESEILEEAADLINFITMQAFQAAREFRRKNGIKLNSWDDGS